jgi:hypothetical protein
MVLPGAIDLVGSNSTWPAFGARTSTTRAEVIMPLPAAVSSIFTPKRKMPSVATMSTRLMKKMCR